MSNIYKYLTSTETELSPVEEALYQQEKKRTGVGDFDYDMRGYYKEFGSLDPISSSNSIYNNGHFVDTYKKPNHITFSTESKYNNALTPNGIAQGGSWIENKDNSWSFKATPYNLTQYSPSEMRDYFNRVEQGVKLDLPIWGQ